jgi:predicted RNA-binding Zn ribbon-like protein
MSRAANPQLVVDFVNTVDWRTDPEHFVEKFASFDDFIRWSQTHDVISEAMARKLSRHGREQPRVAGLFLDRVRSVRDAIYGVLSAVAAGRQASEDDLLIIDGETAGFADRVRLKQTGDGFAWEWDGEEDSFDRVLWPVVQSATELLASDMLARIRECEGPGCGWILLDQTKNGSKRWCEMKTCGNRAKVRRFYERHKKEAAKG